MGGLLNINIFLHLNSVAGTNSLLDGAVKIIAQYLPLVFILLVLYLWFKKGTGNKNLALLSGYSAITGLLINYLITLLYFHPRPFMMNLGKVLIQHPPDTSFPSDHTSFMLSIAVLLIYFKKARAMGLILTIAGFLGGFSRVYCGLHFPGDIAGSVCVALISSLIIFLLRCKLEIINNFLIKLWVRVSGVEKKHI